MPIIGLYLPKFGRVWFLSSANKALEVRTLPLPRKRAVKINIKLKFVESSTTQPRVPECAEIWYTGAKLVSKTENRDGRPQVAMHR